MNSRSKPQLEPRIFWPSAIVVFSIVIFSAAFPEAAGKISGGALSWCQNRLDWFFQFTGFGALIFLLWLAYGRYGKVVLGQPGDKPEFTKLAYIAMIFCSGVGSSLIYWAVAEPIYYLSSPPFGAAAGTTEAHKWLTTYPLFHWGPTGWALYCLPCVPLAYLFYVKKQPVLRLSAACRGIIGDKADGPLGITIDVLGIFGVMGGVGVSLGLGAPLLSKVAQTLFGLPDSLWLNAAILLIWVAIFGTSVYLGLYKGIQVLSKINLYSAFSLLLFVLVAGPTAFILSNVSETLSVLFQNFIRMSLWTDPIAKSGFPQGWTVFYWAWYLAYLALMGIFVARVSKGRTIREVISGMVIWGSLGCWIFIWAFGSMTEYLVANNILDVAAIAKEQGMTTAMISVIASLPGTKIVLFAFMVIEFIFMATSLDSSAYVIATMTTKEMTIESEMQPARWNRILWALAFGGLGLAAVMIGGLKAVQSFAVVAGLPAVFIALLMNLSLLRWLEEDYGEVLASKTFCVDVNSK